MELHILLAGVEFGPYTDDQVRELLGDGFLSETDPAKRLDDAEWLPLSDVLAQPRTATTAPEEPATEIHAEEEEPAAPATESTPEEKPSAETPPESEPAAHEAPEEIAAHETPAPIEAAKDVEASASEPQPTIDAPPTFSQAADEPPAPNPAPVEESAPNEMPEPKQEETPAAATEPAVAATASRQLTAAEKTSFLLPPATAPTPIVSATPLLQVSLPAKAKKALRTGSLLAQDALRAARDQKGILSPAGASAPAPPASAPASEPVEPPAPRRKSPVVLRGREETETAPAPPAPDSTSTHRKAIRLTGRIVLPGASSKPELPPSQPPSLSGPLIISRPARSGVVPRRISTRPLTALEKSSFLTGQIARPADVAREETAAETAEISAAPVTEEKKIEDIPAPPPSPETEPEPVHALVQAAGEETVAEEPVATVPALGSVTALLQAAGTETVAEPPESSADSGMLPTLEEPPTEADLTASGRLMSSGELAERRSLKITGPLRHPIPRTPIRLSSPSKPGDSRRLPYSTGERPPTSALPLLDPSTEPPPLPPAPEESLPHHPETGKIPVSAMPAEGIRIRTRRSTSKVPAVPEKERQPEPELLSTRVTPPPSLPEPETPAELSTSTTKPTAMSITPPPAETGLVVPPPAESLQVAAAEPTVLAEDSPVLPGPTMVVAPVLEATEVGEIPDASTTPATPTAAPGEPEMAKPDKIRLRRPVKLELSSRAKSQESGRLTLEAFSKMASLDLPGKTAPPGATPAAATATAPPVAKETPPKAAAPISPPGPNVTPAPTDYDKTRLEEAPSLVWKSALAKTNPRWEWLAYAFITIGVVAFCAIVYILTHRSGAHAASAPVATTQAPANNNPSTPPASVAPAVNKPSTPPASATPPAPASVPPPSAVPPTLAPSTASTPAKPAKPAKPIPSPAPSTASAPAKPTPVPAKPPAAGVNASIQDLNRQVDAYIGDGILKYQHGEFQDALAADNQALNLNPKSAPALFNRGTDKAGLNDLDGAVADYSAALQIDPSLASAYYYRGLARHSKADLDGALSDYSQAVQFDPKNAHAFFNRGMIRMQKNDIDGAIVDSTRALELDPGLIQCYYNRGLGRLAKGALDGSLSDMKAFCLLAPQDPYTDYARFTCYARLYIWLIECQQGHLAEANQELSKAMNSGWKGAPNSMATRIGEFLLGQISENELIRSSASSIPVIDQSQHCETWYFIGMRRLESGDKQGAIDDLTKCVGTQKIDYCEYILAQEELKNLSPAGTNGVTPPAPRAQAVTLPDPGTMAPKAATPDSAPAAK